MASTSILAGDEDEEDEELRAAATHLCKDVGFDGVDGDEQEHDGHNNTPSKRPSLELLLGKLPTAASLGLTESVNKVGEENEKDLEAEDGELDLNGIDDDEIDRYILNEKEIKVKTELWMIQNADYLKEQKEKEERIAKEKEEGTYKERKPKKSSRRREPINASTADEAIEKMLEQKRISTKINYDVLKDLNKSSPKNPTHQPEDSSAGGKKTPLSRQRKPQLSSPKMAKSISSFGKRLQPLISAQPSKKLAIDQKGAVTPVATPAQNSVVVECGPVAYEDPTQELEEDEEEEHCVSAMQLMGASDYGFDLDDDDGF